MITAMLAVMATTANADSLKGGLQALPVRVIISEDQRKSCKYLGIVSGKQSGGSKNGERALLKAMKKVEKLGGNGLFIVTQTDNWLEGTSITGEALLCP